MSATCPHQALLSNPPCRKRSQPLRPAQAALRGRRTIGRMPGSTQTPRGDWRTGLGQWSGTQKNWPAGRRALGQGCWHWPPETLKASCPHIYASPPGDLVCPRLVRLAVKGQGGALQTSGSVAGEEPCFSPPAPHPPLHKTGWGMAMEVGNRYGAGQSKKWHIRWQLMLEVRPRGNKED